MKKSYLLTLLTSGAIAASGIAWAASPELRAKVHDAIQQKPLEIINTLGRDKSKLPAEGYYTVPFYFTVTNDQYNECLIVPDAAGKKFKYDESEQAFRGDYNSSAPVDFYAYLPPVHLTPGPYKFTVEYKTRNNKENFWIKIGQGQTPEAMTIDLVTEENYSNTSYVTREVTFTIEEEGNYNIGLHQYSDTNMFNTYIRNFTLKAIDNTLPNLPTIEDLSFTGTEGSMTVKAPTTSFDGTPLPSTLDLHILVDNVEYGASPYQCAPGETKTIDITAERGVHEFTTYVTANINGTDKSSEYVTISKRVTKLVNIPLSIPAYVPCDEDDYEYCQILDLNNDNSTWKWANTGNPGDRDSFRYNYSYNQVANDWIIFPAINCTEAGLYELSLDIATKYDGENIEIHIADEPTVAAMTASPAVLKLTNYENANWTTHTADVTIATPGVKYIGVLCNSPAYRSYVYISNLNFIKGNVFKISNPEFGAFNFDGCDGTVNVILPSTTLSGATIDANTDISAWLKIDGTIYGETLIGKPGETVSWTVNLPRGEHSFTTAASYNTPDGISTSKDVNATYKVTRPASFCYELPFIASLKGEEWFEDMYIYNVNEDNKTWEADEKGIKYSYSGSNAADDWAIMLPVNITNADKELELKINALTGNYEEKFSVWMGTAPDVEHMTIPVMEETTVKETAGKDYTATFRVPEAGRYYIGFHCTSIKNQLYICLSNLTLAYVGQFDAIPRQAESLTATANPQGNASATISFTMPTLNAGGNALDTDTELTATIVSEKETKTIKALPASNVSTEIETNEGANEITVTISNENGPAQQQSVTVYCGLDTPRTPTFTSAKITEDGLGIELQWDAVTEGVNGGVINPEMLEYRITPWDEYDEDWNYSESIYTKNLNCIYEVSSDTPQSTITLGIEAFQNASTNSSVSTIEVVIGKPYDENITEEFTNGQFDFGPVYTFSNSTGSAVPQWSLAIPNTVTEAAGSDRYALIGSTTTAGADSGIILPMISTINKESAAFSFDVFVDETTPYMAAFIGTYNTAREIIGEVTTEARSAGWQTYTFDIPVSMLERQWVQPGIYVRFDNGASNNALIGGWQFVSTTSTGISDTLNSGVSVNANNNEIIINGCEDLEVTVCNIDGTVIYAEKANTNTLRIAATQGTHVVLVNGKAFKVLVK